MLSLVLGTTFGVSTCSSPPGCRPPYPSDDRCPTCFSSFRHPHAGNVLFTYFFECCGTFHLWLCTLFHHVLHMCFMIFDYVSLCIIWQCSFWLLFHHEYWILCIPPWCLTLLQNSSIFSSPPRVFGPPTFCCFSNFTCHFAFFALINMFDLFTVFCRACSFPFLIQLIGVCVQVICAFWFETSCALSGENLITGDK